MISPASVTAYAYYRDGTGTRVAYSGRWKIQTSTNGSSWTDVYTGTSNATSTTKTLAKTDKYNFVRFVLYAAGGTTNTLDMQSFPILTDISSLTQLDIVDILSNDGEWDGLYYLNGKLYISFDAAKGGMLALGGKSNGDGIQIIYNADGKRASKSDNNGTLYYKTYTDEKNYTGFLLNKNGISYLSWNDGVETLTPGIIEFVSSERININPRLYFYDWANDGTRRIPISSASNNGTRIAYIASGQGSNSSGKNVARIGVRGQWQGNGAFSTIYFYSDTGLSDARLKEDIKDSQVNALKIIDLMQVRQFDWKEENVHQKIGFVADELEKIDPMLAYGGGYDEEGNIDLKYINSPYLLGYAIKAIQELSETVKEQNKRIEELERRLS